jgi:hypothetical protein
MTVDPLSGAVLLALAEAGVFTHGGVLIGTHAFRTYGPMLARRFTADHYQTLDIDIATIALPNADIALSFSEVVSAVDPALTAVPPRPGSRLSTALSSRAKGLRVELLTPHVKGAPWSPIVARQLGFAAQQAPFLDYLLAVTVEGVYPHAEGFRVSVPHPARYALHKLIVASQRDATREHKATKDAAQAGELIVALSEDRLQDLEDAAAALEEAGLAYVKAAKRGSARLPEAVRALLPKPF